MTITYENGVYKATIKYDHKVVSIFGNDRQTLINEAIETALEEGEKDGPDRYDEDGIPSY